MEKIKTIWKDFEKADLAQWEREARSSFSAEDFCCAEWLNDNWDILKGWVLLNAATHEWVGVMFLSFHEKNNDAGLSKNHFRECWVSEKYRGMGFCQEFYNKMFKFFGSDKEISLCISPSNLISKKAAVKNGFRKTGRYKCWELYKFFPED